MAKKEQEVKMILTGKGCKTTCAVLKVLLKISEVVMIIAAVALAVAGILLGTVQKDVNVSEMVNSANSEMSEAGITLTGPALDQFLMKSHNEQIVFMLTAIALGALAFLFASIVMRHSYRFFKNLQHGKTPFTLQNVDLLQKMATWLFVTLITIDLGSIILSLMMGGETVGVNISLSYYGLGFVLLVMAVVFRHGYELEKKK